MNNAHRQRGHDINAPTQRVRTAFAGAKAPTGDSPGPETGSTGRQRKGHQAPPGTIWHNVLYGIGAAGVALAPLFVPEISYFDVMLGVTAVALGIFLLIMLAGVFQGVLPLGRQAQTGRYRKR